MNQVLNVVIAAILGLAFGNFATTFYYRISKNLKFLGFDYHNNLPPMCSRCGHRLKVSDFFPILGFMKNKGRCRYCNKHITKIYLLIEIYSVVCSILCYVLFHFSDWYILLYISALFSVITSLHLYVKSKTYTTPLVVLLIVGSLYNVLINLSVLDLLLKGVIVFIAIIALMRISFKANIYIMHHTELYKIAIISFFWLDYEVWILYSMFLFITYLLFRKYRIFYLLYCSNYVIISLVSIFLHAKVYSAY